MENKGVMFDETGESTTFTIEVEGGGYEYINTVRSLLRMLGNVEDGIIDYGERTNICNLIASMLPSDEQINLLSNYSPHCINALESDNEILEEKNKYLKSLLDISDETLRTREIYVQLLLKQLNHEDQGIQADHDGTNQENTCSFESKRTDE